MNHIIYHKQLRASDFVVGPLGAASPPRVNCMPLKQVLCVQILHDTPAENLIWVFAVISFEDCLEVLGPRRDLLLPAV